MTPQELKNSILQLAIQGKLVEQRAEEGTAEDLYKQIQAEKQALIKAGKIKKEKPLPEITEDEIPFEIPESWKWVRFGFLGQLLDGEKRQGEPYPCLDAKYLRGKSEALYLNSGKFVYRGEKIILVDGENSGEVFVVPQDGYMGSTFKKLFYSSAMYEQYVLLFLLYHKKDYRNNKKGSAIPHLNKELFFNMPTPIPPLAEQKRIVAKIEELLPLIERYEKAWSRLEDFNKRFPVDMQKSILQMAIQGKLVEQRPEEGTGEELYKQIQAEKQALIKAGKIKKEKPLPEITEDEIPFEIPESWKWYRIGEVFSIVNGFTPLKSNPEFWTNGEIPWFTIEDVHRQGRFISSTEKHISKKALSKNTERIVPPDSVLLCCTASVGEYAYTIIPLTTNQQFNAFVTKPEFVNAVFPMFVYEFAKTLKDTLIRNAGKTTFNFLSVGKLSLGRDAQRTKTLFTTMLAHGFHTADRLDQYYLFEKGIQGKTIQSVDSDFRHPGEIVDCIKDLYKFCPHIDSCMRKQGCESRLGRFPILKCNYARWQIFTFER